MSTLWSTEHAVVQFDSPDGWREFWAEREAGIAEPIRTAQLVPLFIPEADQYVLVHE